MNPLRVQLQLLSRRFSLLNASCCSECCGEQVSITQCKILREVKQRPGSSMQRIAEELGVDITTFSRQVKSMEAKNLVIRRGSPDDRRVSLLNLTPTGVESLDRIDDYLLKRIFEIFGRMSSFEQETVARSLAHLNDAMAVIDITNNNRDRKIVCCK